MAVYLVSFELKYDSGYSDRYNSFVGQLQNGRHWSENTSFVVVETSEGIDEFCSRIYVQSDFNATKDRYLVLDANAKSGRVRGPISDPELFTLLPFVKKL